MQIMERNKSDTFCKKDLNSAIALVEAASLFKENEDNIHIHPSLKRRLAIEIAKKPELTSELFKAEFLDKFLKLAINDHKD